jgi:hypothetical protein
VFTACLFAAALSAQTGISIGVKGGVPLTDPFADRTYNFVVALIKNPFGPPRVISQSTRVFSGSRSFVLGPTLELQLPFGLAVEADALYRPINVSLQSTTFLPLLTDSTPVLPARADRWEFPLLAKYRLPVPFLKPYIEAGPTFRTSQPQQISTKGISAGVGFEAQVGHFRIAPEVRYTHWGSDGTNNQPYYAVSYPNQIEFLAGFATRPVTPTGSASFQARRLISMGLKGGFPFTTAFQVDEFEKLTYPPVRCGDFRINNPSCSVTGIAQQFKASRNYLVGPMVELRLPYSLSIEGDALYHPLSLGVLDARVPEPPSIKTFNSWEFPVVGKYRVRAPFVTPYFEAGPTFRTASSPYGHYLSKAGITAGLGVEAVAWRIHIAPEVRFVHWGQDSPDAGVTYASRRNQAQFLLGFSY